MPGEQTPGAASTNTSVHGTGKCEWFMVMAAMAQGANLGFKGEEGRDGAERVFLYLFVKIVDQADPRLH